MEDTELRWVQIHPKDLGMGNCAIRRSDNEYLELQFRHWVRCGPQSDWSPWKTVPIVLPINP